MRYYKSGLRAGSGFIGLKQCPSVIKQAILRRVKVTVRCDHFGVSTPQKKPLEHATNSTERKKLAFQRCDCFSLLLNYNFSSGRVARDMFFVVVKNVGFAFY
jgi:hypothetical protein